MRKSTLPLLVILCVFATSASWADETSLNSFKHYMHKVFDSYNHARISYTLNKYEITDIHLRDMKAFIALAQKRIPERDRHGDRIDQALFAGRVARLQTAISDLRDAVKYKEPLLTELFARDIFNICVACHKEMKFDHLFRIPQQMTLFGEYMHMVSEHVDLARISKEQGKGPEALKKHLQLINYYLDLLKTSLPDAGPSGVILDKAAFNRRIQEIQERLRGHGKPGREPDLAHVREDINGLCVACHEPERLK